VFCSIIENPNKKQRPKKNEDLSKSTDLVVFVTLSHFSDVIERRGLDNTLRTNRQGKANHHNKNGRFAYPLRRYILQMMMMRYFDDCEKHSVSTTTNPSFMTTTNNKQSNKLL
jgi:hypothetical protein